MKFPTVRFRKILFVLLIIGIIYNFGSVVWQQRDKYLSHEYWKNFPVLTQKYLDSQYINKHPKDWLRDEVVFAYAGGALIKGTNPVLVIPDAPPLGKYLIGISILLFNNEHVFTALFGIIAFILFYFLGVQVLKDKLLSLIAVFFYSFEPMTKNQFIFTPLMDIFQLVFVLGYFYFFNKGFLSKKKTILFFVLANLFLGFFISTKFFVSGTSIIAASILMTVFHKNREKFMYLLATLPIAVGVLLLSYSRVFAFGYSFREFLGIQKWVFLYHQSNLILPFSVWPLLLFNKWFVWFGDVPVISDSQWFITWPIITVLSFLTICFYVFKKINKRLEIEILMIWAVCGLVFLSVGQIFSRYFIILLPALYIISIYGISEFAKSYMHRGKTRKK